MGISKFIQGKSGNDLAYPKTLIDAVFKSENGDSIKEDILGMPSDREAAAAAIVDIWEKCLSALRIVLHRSDVVDALNKPWSERPLSARMGNLLDAQDKEIELIAAAALNDMNSTKAFVECVAPRYNGQKVYSVGDYCTEYGKLWKCDTAYTVSEPVFDAAKWHTTTIVEEFLNN